MLQTLPFTVRRFSKFFIPALLLLMAVNDVVAQCGYPSLKGVRITDNMGTTHYPGFIEYKPPGYDLPANASTNYPLIIYFHGLAGVGNGSAAQLCNIVTDQSQFMSHLVDRIEDGTFGSNIVPTVSGTSFLVIAPQYASYANAPGPWHYSNQTDAMIDYVVNRYRVDPSRIYLVGMSTGANNIMDYLSSSADRAGRIAAAAFGALCFETVLSSSGTPAQNLVTGDVGLWFVHCPDASPGYCGMTAPQSWVDAIAPLSPTVQPRFSVLQSNGGGGGPAYPQSLENCQGDVHNGWTSLFDPLFLGASAPGPNLYNWLLQFQQESALPIVLKNFSARLSNGKVYLRWITSAEQNNAGFVIERAGSNGSYSAITQVSGGGNTSGDKVYEYVDENPLPNLSYYRLKQMDLDGVGRYHEVRKVMNQGRFKSKIIVTPNPFASDPSAFVSVDRKQHLNIFLTDMSGRILSRVNGIYEEGTTELSLPTSSLPRGVYFIRMQGEGIAETHKIIKQ
jgi:hypothetical protein